LSSSESIIVSAADVGKPNDPLHFRYNRLDCTIKVPPAAIQFDVSDGILLYKVETTALDPDRSI